MKTYTNGPALREGLRKFGARSVWVEVDAELIAGLMGRTFTGPEGHVISLERVGLYRAENGVLVADPVVLRREPADADAA